jgi:tetratricopeptide (TPR) repeat protein
VSTLLCPMLTALKPVDEAGQPVNRECIYEQCRFFNTEKRDCTLMMASRAMLRMSDEAARKPDASAPAAADFDRSLATMGKDLLSSSLEVQGVVRESGLALLEKIGGLDARSAAIEGRIGGLETRFDSIDATLTRRLEEMEQRIGGLLHDRLNETANRLGGGIVERFGEALNERIGQLERSVGQEIASVRTHLEEKLRAAAARYEEQSRAIADNGTIFAQVAAGVSSLSDMQQRVAEKLLEEISLVTATAHKVEQLVGGLDQKVARSVEEYHQLNQLVTLIKGETERTFAALRGLHEGNRAVIQTVETQLQRDQADLKRRQRDEAQSCNNRGVIAYYRGALEAASEGFRQAIHLQPDFAEAHNNLGLVLSKTGQDKAAVEAFQQALKLDPKMGEAYNNLGFLYDAASQFDRAVEMFGQAVQSSADTSVAYTNLGNTFYKMKRPEKAVEAWRRALELDPMNENARRGLRMFQQDPSHN